MRWLIIVVLGIAVVGSYAGFWHARATLSGWGQVGPSNAPLARDAGQAAEVPVAPRAADAPPAQVVAQTGVPAATAIIGKTRAISGDTIEFQGHILHLAGLTCPDPETADGKTAKTLMNTFVTAPYMQCNMASGGGDVWEGTCTRDGREVVGGLDIAEGMRKSGLCK